MHTRKVLASAAVLGLVLVGGARAQEAPYGELAYGLDPEALVSGELPPGWIPLVGEPLALEPQVAARPLASCSTEIDPLDTTWKNAPWPGGVVYYEFDANVTAFMQTRALAAFAVLQSFGTPIVFVPRSGEGDYIHMQDDSINQSPVGYGGQRTVRILNWNFQAIIVHELLHALGFYHEQSRPDRDFYVQIISSNIQSGKENNFEIRGSAYYWSPYDFGSVMHYGQCDFTICPFCTPGCETILTQPAYSAFQTTMGQRVAMSPLDVHGLMSLYPQSWWRFVAWNPVPGSGTGLDPWQELSSALTSAPSGARVFVMPGTYSGPALGTTAMTIEAPIGGVVAQ